MEPNSAFAGPSRPSSQQWPPRRRKMPCSNCTMSGNDYSKSDASTSLTLSQAHQEIAALRRKVMQLEAELEGRASISSHQMDSAGAEIYFEYSKQPGYWGGVQFRPARSTSSRPVWLGPSSLYSYVQRLSAFLSLKLHQEHPADQLLPISASDKKLLDRPSANLRESVAYRLSPSTCEHPPKPVYLTPIQEDYFISYFWQTHYQSLWIAGGKERRDSPLVDIVVAMCMQYHISTLPLAFQGFLVDGKDALSPSLSTLQCHLLCAVYLCGGSFHNMLDIAVSTAVRTAYTLGLHVDPPSSMPGPERELRRRLWWAVYVMDSKAGMKLGRPFSLDDTHAMPALPSDTFEAATMSGSGSAFVPVAEDTTWLSFNLHQTKLYMTVRSAYNAFYDKDFHLQDGQTIWDDPNALQASADVLAQFAPSLQIWCEDVPNALRLLRQGNGKPFSTDSGSASFFLEQFAPPWLQRQRVLLELSYHHLCINLYRPMISFSYRPSPGSLIEELALRCTAHVVSLTKITHQVIQETSILDGWHEAFYFQWNAAMTLIGAIMASPFSSVASDIKSALTLAVSVFENFGARVPVAANAMKIIRCLLCKIEILEHEQDLHRDGSVDYSGEALWEDLSSLPKEHGHSFNGVSVSHTEGGSESTGRSELELLDLAGDVDFWNSVDML
ncbi:hypothetical protein BDW72DRAFT_204268 [Aspergillus terricola var. indicus]